MDIASFVLTRHIEWQQVQIACTYQSLMTMEKKTQQDTVKIQAEVEYAGWYSRPLTN